MKNQNDNLPYVSYYINAGLIGNPKRSVGIAGLFDLIKIQLEERFKMGNYTEDGIRQYAVEKISKISDELSWIFGKYSFFVTHHNSFLCPNYDKDSEITIGFSDKNQEDGKGNSQDVCFIKITFPRKLENSAETKRESNNITDDFNIKVCFGDILEGTTFKTEFGDFYTKIGPQEASYNRTKGHFFAKNDHIFIANYEGLKQKEYIFKHNDRCYYLRCHGYSLESTIKNHDIIRDQPGWYLFSIDGVQV